MNNEIQQLNKVLLLKGGSDILDMNKVSDAILSMGKSKEQIYDNVVNNYLGGLLPEEENHENLKKLFTVILGKLDKKNVFANSTKITKKTGGIIIDKKPDFRQLLIDTINKHTK